MAEAESFLRTAERTATEFVQGAERAAERAVPAHERDLIRRALDLSTRKKLQLVRRLWQDPRIRDTTRVPMVAGLAYMVLPVKVLPPVLAPLRPFEKVIGLGLILWLIIRLTPEHVLREHLDAVERPGVLRRMLRRE